MRTYIKWFSIAVLSIFAVVALFSSFFVTQPGTVTLLTRLGSVSERVYQEGPHLKFPFIEKANALIVQPRTYDAQNVDAGTKDLQSVNVKLAIVYKVEETAAIEVFRNYRDVDTLAWRILNPAVEEVFKAVAANHSAEELITKRTSVRDSVVKSLRAKVKDHNISILDVNVVNFRFAPSFAASVDEKVVAEQRALKARHELDRIKTEGESRVAAANAEAAATRVIAEAVKSQGGAEYVQLKWIEKWNGALPTHNLGNSQTMLGLK